MQSVNKCFTELRKGDVAGLHYNELGEGKVKKTVVVIAKSREGVKRKKKRRVK